MPKPNDMPAFPINKEKGDYTQEGMTLRDYFSNTAMLGLLISNNTYPIANKVCVTKEEISKTAFEMADAMLKAREEGTNNE